MFGDPLAALLGNDRAPSSMNCPVDTPTTRQARVRRIDDRIDLERGDVTFAYRYLGHASGGGTRGHAARAAPPPKLDDVLVGAFRVSLELAPLYPSGQALECVDTDSAAPLADRSHYAGRLDGDRLLVGATARIFPGKQLEASLAFVSWIRSCHSR